MAMKSIIKLSIMLSILAVVLSSTVFPFIPVTGAQNLEKVSQSLIVNSAVTASKIDLAETFNYTIVQQPKGNAGFVSTQADKLTQFSLAAKYGSQGFLAHNYLAGASFFNLVVGSEITVTYSDGHSQTYEVREIRHLQAIHPNSPTTSFLDIDHKNVKLSAKQVFLQTYGIKNQLILQTCIAKGDELSWGRLFIIAKPVK
jgi:hypothetical protein